MPAARDQATVYDAFRVTAAKHAGQPFLCVLDETARAYGIPAGEVSYGTFAGDVTALRNQYAAAGYTLGLRVGLLLENRPSFLCHWLALNGLGVSVVPINPDLKADELEYLVQHSEMCAAVVLPARRHDILMAASATDCDIVVFGPDDPIEMHRALSGPPTPPVATTECALLYTSGTTGRPKGCVLDNTYFLNCGRWYLDVGGHLKITEGKARMLTPLPLFHMNAMATSTVTMILSGGCLTVLDRFHPKTWWHSVKQSRATIVHTLGVVPPMLMKAEPSSLDRDHSVAFGFGPGVDGALHSAFEARFGFPLIEAWGMTETGGGVVIAAAFEPRHVGTACFGRTGPEGEARIVSDDGADVVDGTPGELLVRRTGPDPRHGFFRAYLKDPEATAEAWAGGWFHTGDIVRRGPDGALHFVDRKKNVIRRSGENIAAVEVEGAIQQHPGVTAVAVGAVADSLRGDEVFACIIAREPVTEAMQRQALAESIAQHCLLRLAYYKAPGFIAFVDALPVTATQKIQRGAMKDLIAKLAGNGAAIDLRHLKKRSA